MLKKVDSQYWKFAEIKKKLIKCTTTNNMFENFIILWNANDFEWIFTECETVFLLHEIASIMQIDQWFANCYQVNMNWRNQYGVFSQI